MQVSTMTTALTPHEETTHHFTTPTAGAYDVLAFETNEAILTGGEPGPAVRTHHLQRGVVDVRQTRGDERIVADHRSLIEEL